MNIIIKSYVKKYGKTEGHADIDGKSRLLRIALFAFFKGTSPFPNDQQLVVVQVNSKIDR